MTSAHLRLSRVSTAIALSFALAAAPAAAAGYLKLGDIKGESTASGHEDEIEVHSVSWNMSPSGSSKGSVAKAAADTVDKDEKITIHSTPTEESRLTGKRTPPDVTLKRGKSRSTAQSGRGLDIGQVDGEIAPPGTAASGPGSAQSISVGGAKSGGIVIGPGELEEVALSKRVPASRGRGSLTAVVPTGTCKVGARYPTAELGTGGRVYRLQDVVVSACAPAASAGGPPMEQMSMQYARIR